MSSTEGFTCSCCGRWIQGLPFDYGYDHPYYWQSTLASDPNSFLNSDVCVIEAQDFFVRGLVEIPVIGSDKAFRWGAWVSLSKKNFDRAMELWNSEERVAEPAYFGWFSSQIGSYPDTLNLRTAVRARSLNERFYIELEPTDHPLAVEQRNGITIERIREIASKSFRHS